MTIGPRTAYALIATAMIVMGQAAPSLAKPSIDNGRRLYVATGCYQCHGYVGQGGSAGLRLAPEPMPAEALRTFLRNSVKLMPSYSESILSDAAIDDIHAFLNAIPPAKKPEDIELLKGLK